MPAYAAPGPIWPKSPHAVLCRQTNPVGWVLFGTPSTGRPETTTMEVPTTRRKQVDAVAANADDLSREPTPDPAEDNAYFPSPYSLSQYTTAKTDFAGVKHKDAYTGGRWKVLMIAA